MNKTKIGIFGAVAAVIITAVSILAVQADTSPLAVTCAGSVSNNVVTWTATPTGGNSPYALLWSGDSSVAGSTSTSIQVTYGTNATYTAMIQATDASSTVATSSCSAIVNSNVVTTPTSTLNVFVGVNNAAGGNATSSNFVITIGGNASANPVSFNGNAAGTAAQVNASSTYGVSVSSFTNYAVSAAGNCEGPVAAGATASCTITETYVAPTVTPPAPTSTLPRVNQPTLSIGMNGAFIAQGMTVTSVASGSFQGTVWGITYTVNWSGNLFPQFYFRGGNSASSTTNPVTQLAVGDEVSVTGMITTANPLVVTAKTVRDYSITAPRPGKHIASPTKPTSTSYNGGSGNGNGNNNGNNDNGKENSFGNFFNQIGNWFKGGKH